MNALLPGHPASLKRGVAGFFIAHEVAKLGLHLWIAGIVFFQSWWWLGLIVLFLYPYSRYVATLAVLWAMWERGAHGAPLIAWCLLVSMVFSVLELAIVTAMEPDA